LQVRHEWSCGGDDRPRRRQPQEITGDAEGDLWNEKVVIGRQQERGREREAALDLLFSRRSFSALPWPGFGLMPFTTVLATVKLLDTRLQLKMRFPLVVLRSSNSTSDGELTRVGTAGVLNVGGPEVSPTSESFGKTR
jgi:hypothetical protein